MATARTGKKAPKFDARSFLATTGAARAAYAQGGVVFEQGTAADAVFYIQKGRVQISILSEQGKEGVIGVMGLGDFFGEGCLAGQPLHLATATALSDASIVKIGKDTMVRVLRDEPSFSELFMAFLLTRNIEVEAELVDHLFNSSEKRLARVLLLLANFGKDGTLQPIPKVSQEMLAARVGTTRSRINFFMNKFRKLGLIEYDGEIRVHSALLNVIVHDD
ncbi:MAG: Crp/Fnr family transcriptional regulator [Alphaproteobacteria bacterium]